MPTIPHVALLIEASRAYGRGILQGVIRYQREHGPWSIYFQPQGLDAPLPPWLKTWKGDGILARIGDRKSAQVIRKTGVPAIDMRFAVLRHGFPCVGIDNEAIVHQVVEHLLGCGFKQFAFCGVSRPTGFWLNLRGELFQKLVCARGYPCRLFDSKGIPQEATPIWEHEQTQIADWLVRLPKPIGIFACNDDRGQQVLDACRRVGILVPDEVAVIGVDNDEILCNLAYPPMSSVDINTQQVGYEAAALLDRLMKGAKAPKEPLFLPPHGIVARESTNVLATDDRELAAAIRIIREHACEGLRIKDLIRKITLSRRELERRIRRLLGRSPKEEILRVQIERAKQLLTMTDLSAAVISEKCGFSEPKYFSQVFRMRAGQSPAAYRKSKR